MNDNLTVICMDAMKKMTDRELHWIIKHGTDCLHDRLLLEKLGVTE